VRSAGSKLRLTVIGHFIWIGAVVASLLILEVLTGEAAKPTAVWAVMIGVPLVVVVLSALIPVNLLGAYFLWASRGRVMATAVAVALIGAAWFALSAAWLVAGDAGEPLSNPTTAGAGLAGLGFGIGMAWAIRPRDSEPVG
jgi:hypothetical protein